MIGKLQHLLFSHWLIRDLKLTDEMWAWIILWMWVWVLMEGICVSVFWYSYVCNWFGQLSICFEVVNSSAGPFEKIIMSPS